MVSHAYGIARAKASAQFSTCLSSHYGAEIIDPVSKRSVASGFNGAPRGKDHCTDKGYCFKRDVLGYNHFQEDVADWAGLIYCCCNHDTTNAIISAGERAWGCYMYLWGERANGVKIIPKPCFACTKIILNAGIEKLIIEGSPGNYIEINPSALYDEYIKEMAQKYENINEEKKE